jgi:hypothetical protein
LAKKLKNFEKKNLRKFHSMQFIVLGGAVSISDIAIILKFEQFSKIVLPINALSLLRFLPINATLRN